MYCTVHSILALKVKILWRSGDNWLINIYISRIFSYTVRMFTITDWMYKVQSSPWSSIPGLLRCQGSRSHGSYSGPHPTPTLGWHGGLGGHAAQVQVRLQANTAEDLHSLAHLDLVPALQDPVRAVVLVSPASSFRTPASGGRSGVLQNSQPVWAGISYRPVPAWTIFVYN